MHWSLLNFIQCVAIVQEEVATVNFKADTQYKKSNVVEVQKHK